MIKLEPAKYKGYEIFWSDWNKSFDICMDDNSVKDDFKTLEACEKWIDQKTKEKWKRTKAILKSWRMSNQGMGGSFIFGEVTSVIDVGHLWFVTSDGKRSKESFDCVFIDNEVNRNILDFVKSNDDKIKPLIDASKAELEKLEPLTIADLK